MSQLTLYRRPALLRGILRQRRKYNRALSQLFSRKLQALPPRTIPYDRVCAAVHDLKNPICSILNLSEVLLDTPFTQLEEKNLRDSLELIKRLARQMNNLAIGMLPSTSSEKEAERIKQPAESLLSEALSLWRPLAAERGISLQVAGIPKNSSVTCDRHGIFRVFSNLIGNAVQHSEPGTTITLSAEQENGEILFKVRDQGCGIPTDKLRLVFERYWQGEPGKSQGIGLGLAIARDIVSDHGGRIWAENPRDGRGSLFCFSLPA